MSTRSVVEHFTHLSADAALMAMEDNTTRIQRVLSDRFVAHRRLAEILDHARFLLLQPPQTRAWGLVVMGEPGAGKTMLAKSILRQFPPTPALEKSPMRIPAVMISMTGAREARTIFNRILEALAAPMIASMRGSDRERLVIRLLRDAQTRLLIVDEIQDILQTTVRQREQSLETIKFLMNELQLPLLALGIPKAMLAMKSDPHLNARFEYAELPNWKVGDDLAALLTALENALPLRRPSHLSSPSTMKEIVRLTKGILAKIVRLINHAAVQAITSDSECIDVRMLAAAMKVPSSQILH